MLSGYIAKMRSMIGTTKLIHPAARIIIENSQGEFLFIRRTDNGMLGLPAGGIEENETIKQCIIREVKEETGLDLLDCQIIGIGSRPELETMTYPNGDQTQYLVIEFYSKQYSGSIQADGIESASVAFYPKSFISQLPLSEQGTFQHLEHFQKNGSIFFE